LDGTWHSTYDAFNLLTSPAAPTYAYPVGISYHAGTKPATQVSISMLFTSTGNVLPPLDARATLEYTLNGVVKAIPVSPTQPYAATVMDAPATDFPRNVRNNWTWCVLANRLYAYHPKLPYVLRMNQLGTAWQRLNVTFVKIADIAGIFSARGRLGCWDIAGAIYTSSDICSTCYSN